MLTTEKAFDILPYVSDIYEKIDAKEYIRKNREKDKENEGTDLNLKYMLSGLDLFSFILKQSGKVKDEFFNIVAIVEEKGIEEVKKQSFAKTMETIKEIFTDKDLIDFFKSAMQ